MFNTSMKISSENAVSGQYPFSGNNHLIRGSVITEDARRRIEPEGFVLIRGNRLAMPDNLAQGIAEFRSSWTNLIEDPYLPNGSRHRFRRYSRFTFDPITGDLKQNADTSFYQSRTINRVAGGIAREFAPLEEMIREGDILRSLIRFDFSLLSISDSIKLCAWDVNVHQIRIVGSYGVDGSPTPEGVHRDGHMFVGQHLIHRENVEGCVSVVCHDNGSPFDAALLAERFDSIIVDDLKIKHFASPIKPLVSDLPAIRDMLLIDFHCPLP